MALSGTEELASDRSVDTLLSLSSGAKAFEPDPVGELLGFSMCEALRGAPLTAARIGRSLAGDAEAEELRKEIAAATRRLNQLAGRSPGEEGAPGEEGGEGGATFSELVRERDRLQRRLLARVEESEVPRLLPNLDAQAIAARLSEHEAAAGYWRYDRWEIDPETSDESTTPSYLAWVLRPGEPLRRIELGPADAIEEAIEAWRRSVVAPLGSGGDDTGDVAKADAVAGQTSDDRPLTSEQRAATGITRGSGLGRTSEQLSERLRTLLFDPLVEHVGDSRRLWLTSAEALNTLPFEALPLGEELLGDRYEIVALTSLGELTLEPTGELVAPSLLSIGGIDYDAAAVGANASEALAAAPSDEAPSALTGAEESGIKAGENRDTRSAGASIYSLRGTDEEERGDRFEALAGAALEAQEIGRFFREAEGPSAQGNAALVTLLQNAEATRSAFEALAPSHRYLHLATHGWFAPESVASTRDDRSLDKDVDVFRSPLRDQVIGLAPSLLCGLAFAGANDKADMYGRVQGVMTAEEISTMNLSGVELCVLSACETNVGLRRSGQGLESLQSALHAAGVRTAITSLWKVPDEATRELMTELYRRLWVLKEPKAQALWNAKKKLREQLDRDGKPVYSIRDWAGWVLSGDPD